MRGRGFARLLIGTHLFLPYWYSRAQVRGVRKISCAERQLSKGQHSMADFFMEVEGGHVDGGVWIDIRMQCQSDLMRGTLERE